MSKKTQNIYKSLDELEGLQKEISIINQLAKNHSIGEDDEKFLSEQNHHLEKIEFELMQQIKSLRFWIDSLYAYNGKSTSRAKQNASKENGKKGGRPPKWVTEARRRIFALENTEIPEMERAVKMAMENEEENKLRLELDSQTTEMEALKEKLKVWEENRA